MNNVYNGNYFQIEVREDDIIIFKPNFKDTISNVKWFDLIDDLDGLVYDIKTNPPQFNNIDLDNFNKEGKVL